MWTWVIGIAIGSSPLVVILVGLAMIARGRRRSGMVVVVCGPALYALIAIGIKIAPLLR